MNFEELVKEREFNIDRQNTVSLPSNPKPIRQKSEKGCSLFDCISMIATLVELTMPGVRFEPDEAKVMTLDGVQEFNQPVISYIVVERETKKEIKPRMREQVIELDVETNENRVGEIWGQKFKCLIQFNIFASVYKEAEQVMEKFEETIIKHSGFLKRNGVAEIFFQKHFTDSHYDMMRESLSVRNIQYYVEIEKSMVMFKEKIDQIEIIAQKKKDEEEK